MDRGLALYQSLIQRGTPFHLWILCMDAEARDLLAARKLTGVSLLTVDDLARRDPDVLIARGNRSLVEFYFTSKSFLCRHIFDTHPDVELLTYVDADCFFFSDPAAILAEMDGHSVGLTPHRFPPHLKSDEQYGLFNAGFTSFRRDEVGLACLDWWRASCLEWCHDHVSEGRFADQRYLDAMPGMSPRVRLMSKGMNAAPWNISQDNVSLKEGAVMIDDSPLVLFHFHGVRRLGPCIYDSGFAGYKARLSDVVRRSIYKPYLAALRSQVVPRLAASGKSAIRGASGKYQRLRRLVPFVFSFLELILALRRGWPYRSVVVCGK